MFRGCLHSSTSVGVEKILPLRASAPILFPPIGEKESYEKNTSTLFTLFGFIAF
jgi:hypothetical protein